MDPLDLPIRDQRIPPPTLATVNKTLAGSTEMMLRIHSIAIGRDLHQVAVVAAGSFSELRPRGGAPSGSERHPSYCHALACVRVLRP
jgi:hypothetical protein